jgi:hypothetical protein
MEWILILMVFAQPNYNEAAFSVTSPNVKFESLEQCKAFVAVLREEHESKRFDASCIAIKKGGTK